MDDLVEYFEKASADLKTLSNDLKKMAAHKDKKNKGEESKLSTKSLQPMTRLRKSKEDIIIANENPELAFVEDKLNDIFK